MGTKSMKIIKTPSEMLAFSKAAKAEGKKISLVPTMGSLHEGHLSLIDIAKKNSDICVVSIFVNPTQFSPNEDFASYPREQESDFEKCESRGADAVFAPDASDIYPPDASTFIDEESISMHLCGKSRPRHFKGVTTIVGILFNIVRPDLAVFGEKDAQQLSIIKRMVRDLFFDVEILSGEIVREENGLAMSSRNKYMDKLEREGATKMRSALLAARDLAINENCTNVDRIKAKVVNEISSAKIRIIYVEIVDSETSLPMNQALSGKSRIAAAIWYGNTRLIDNIRI